MSEQDNAAKSPLIPPPTIEGKRRASPMSWTALALTVVTLGILVWLWQQTRTNDVGVKGRLAQVERTVRDLQDLTQATRNTAIAAENIADALEKRLDATDHHLDARTDALQTQINDLNESVNSISGFLRQRKSTVLLVTEAKNLIAQTQHHLQFGGEVKPVISALEAANQHLRETGDSSLFDARKAIDEIIGSLKKHGDVDISALAEMLSALDQQIDQLPVPGNDTKQRTDGTDNTRGVSGFFVRAWNDIKGLISIRHQTDPKEIALLPPERRFFLRQNLHLQVATARLALLQRNNRVFHETLKTMHDWITTYYDPKTPEAQKFLNILTQQTSVDLSLPEPDFRRALELLSDWQQRQQPAAKDHGAN